MTDLMGIKLYAFLLLFPLVYMRAMPPGRRSCYSDSSSFASLLPTANVPSVERQRGEEVEDWEVTGDRVFLCKATQPQPKTTSTQVGKCDARRIRRSRVCEKGDLVLGYGLLPLGEGLGFGETTTLWSFLYV